MIALVKAVQQRPLPVEVYAIVNLFALPLRRDYSKSLYDSEEGLTGSQIQRGAFMNSGSKDVGRDHDWNKDTREWTGKRNKPGG